MSLVKERKCFLLEGEPGESCFILHESAEEKNAKCLTPVVWRKFKGIRDLKSYCELFQGVSNELAIGQASPEYIYIPKSLDKIEDSASQGSLFSCAIQ